MLIHDVVLRETLLRGLSHHLVGHAQRRPGGLVHAADIALGVIEDDPRRRIVHDGLQLIGAPLGRLAGLAESGNVCCYQQCAINIAIDIIKRNRRGGYPDGPAIGVEQPYDEA